MKERLPGYFEVRAEIDYLLFRLNQDCRVMRKLIKNASDVLKECNRTGSITSASLVAETFKKDLAKTQQKVIRESNKARSLFISFLEKQEKKEVGEGWRP
jgi:hypothetical protein